MKKKSFAAFGFLCVVVFLGAVPPGAICAERINLNWAGFAPKTSPETIDFQELFVDKVNDKAKGELFINYRGGPETIQAYDLGMAVQRGVVDIATTPVGYYEPLVPGIGAAMLTSLTPQEERKPGGAYYYLLELHNQKGFYYLGRGSPSKEPFFFTHLNKKVETQKDFVGLRIGCATAARAASLAWGATVSPTQIPDYYNAMERNLVEAISGCPLDTYVAVGAHEVTKYVIDHPYYASTVSVYMNLNSWNKLPKRFQDLIIESMIQYEKEKLPKEGERRAAARQKMIASKVQFYKLTPSVAEWYLKTAYDAAWEYQQKKFPDVTPKLRALMSK